MATELTFNVCRSRNSDNISSKNFNTGSTIVRQVFSDLEAQCLEEKFQYEKTGHSPTPQRENLWATYTNRERLREFMKESMDFIRDHSECRMKVLPHAHLRFLILLQHFISEDAKDCYRPECERKHYDAFEGVLTNGVNSQLVKDAHRSEWSVEGRTFSEQAKLAVQSQANSNPEERRHAIVAFQREFVESLESYLLEFCRRRGLSSAGTEKLLQVVTTQMSQCGLANLDRASQAAKYFVSGQGLEQRTAYNISTMDGGSQVGESLKLSMLCMKTGFTQYHTAEALNMAIPVGCGPQDCSPSSYLYQYATLRFTPGPLLGGCEQTNCVVIDALDEVHIEPAVDLDRC